MDELSRLWNYYVNRYLDEQENTEGSKRRLPLPGGETVMRSITSEATPDLS